MYTCYMYAYILYAIPYYVCVCVCIYIYTYTCIYIYTVHSLVSLVLLLHKSMMKERRRRTETCTLLSFRATNDDSSLFLVVFKHRSLLFFRFHLAGGRQNKQTGLDYEKKRRLTIRTKHLLVFFTLSSCFLILYNPIFLMTQFFL